MRKHLYFIVAVLFLVFPACQHPAPKIFDVHLHGDVDPSIQINTLNVAGVYKVALSSSWKLQNDYKDISEINFLYGLMFPCPNGKVPYSLQPCYSDGKDWPEVNWVEDQIIAGKINFMGEVLAQYYGISPSDDQFFPYYELAQKYNLPVGIHTGGAGPDHGSPNFKLDLGNPLLMKEMLDSFPELKVWIMHSGDQYYQEAIEIMKAYKRVYADISVISNPDILPSGKFSSIMKTFINEGLEDRLMFGTDNGDINKIVSEIEKLDFLSDDQKEKIYYRNAERFFTESE